MMMKHNWIKRNKRLSALAACAALSCSLLAGCVDQSGGDAGEGTADGSASSQTESVETMLEITDPEEKAAVEAAKAKVQGMEGEPRIIATSPSTAEICDRLELDLVGVCSSSIDKAAQPTPSTDTELNDAQGLSLSTGADASEEAEETGSSGGGSAFAIGAAATVSGLILMGTAAVIVYFFRKNWKRWGGGYDDDEA